MCERERASERESERESDRERERAREREGGTCAGGMILQLTALESQATSDEYL